MAVRRAQRDSRSADLCLCRNFLVRFSLAEKWAARSWLSYWPYSLQNCPVSYAVLLPNEPNDERSVAKDDAIKN